MKRGDLLMQVVRRAIARTRIYPVIQQSTCRTALRIPWKSDQVVIHAQPFASWRALALAKGYQDAANFDLRKPRSSLGNGDAGLMLILSRGRCRFTRDQLWAIETPARDRYR